MTKFDLHRLRSGGWGLPHGCKCHNTTIDFNIQLLLKEIRNNLVVVFMKFSSLLMLR